MECWLKTSCAYRHEADEYVRRGFEIYALSENGRFLLRKEGY